MQFSPCRGGMNCSKEGSHCEGCGRSHAEIAETKQLSEAIADYVLKMDYENVEDFLQFVAFKAYTKVRMAKMEAQGAVEL